MVKFSAGNPWNLICILVTSPVHIRCSSMRAHPSGIGLHPQANFHVLAPHPCNLTLQTQPEARFLDSLILICTAKRGRWVLQGSRHGKHADFISASLHFYGSNLKKVAPPEPSRDAHLPEHWKLKKYKAWGLRSNIKRISTFSAFTSPQAHWSPPSCHNTSRSSDMCAIGSCLNQLQRLRCQAWKE